MFLRSAFGLLIVAVAALATPAQPPITSDPLSATPTPAPSATAVLASDPVPPAVTDSFDVIVGLPLAVRYQRRIGQSRFWGEAGAGLILIVPDVFVGVRTEWGLYEGRWGAFRVRPGLDAHVAVWPWGSLLGDTRGQVAVVGGVALDADFLWLSECDGGQIELGLKLGVLTLVNRNGVAPVPTVGLLCGYRF